MWVLHMPAMTPESKSSSLAGWLAGCCSYWLPITAPEIQCRKKGVRGKEHRLSWLVQGAVFSQNWFLLYTDDTDIAYSLFCHPGGL